MKRSCETRQQRGLGNQALSTIRNALRAARASPLGDEMVNDGGCYNFRAYRESTEAV